jgi:hypothetical protein
MKTAYLVSALAVMTVAAPAFAQDYRAPAADFTAYAGPGSHHAYHRPRAFNGHIVGRREAGRRGGVNGNANGNNLTRSNGS